MTQLEALDYQGERFNPFPGLRPFEPEEDHLFFGRERETDELLRRLRTNRFVSVLGTSGSGKSSLVRSGLIPSLQGGFMVKAGSAWRVAMLRPGEDPVGNLARALNAEEVLGGDPELAHTNQMLLETTLRRSSLGLADCVRHAHLPEHENLLVVVDQFEELFRFKERREADGARDEAVAFAKLLLDAAAQAEMPVYVVITMRSDFIGDCMEYPKLPETINEGQYLIPRMTREELRAAITGPVAVGGGTIAPRLVARLLNEIGDDPDQLPVLQHALMRTWDEWETDSTPDTPLDLAHYESIGTMAEALSRHAEDAFAELDPRARQIAEYLFKALTDKGQDGRGVRRPTAVSDVAEIAGVDNAQVVAVVDTFRRPGRSFLMPPSQVELTGDSIIDLSHESLMRLWTRLVEWVSEEESSGKAFRRLCRASRRHAKGQAGLWVQPELALGLKWREENRPTAAWALRYAPDFREALAFLDESQAADERRIEAEEDARRRKLRRARVLATVLGSAAVLTLVFGLFALRAGRIARAAEQRATREADTAQAVSGFLVDLFDVVDPEEARGATITAREILDSGAAKADTELADQPGVQARLKTAIGKVYGSLGLYSEARPLLETARETATGALGPEAPETLESMHQLAAVYHQEGEFDEAASLLEQVVEARRRVLGATDAATLESLSELAGVYQSQGRYAEAETAARQAMEAARSTLGSDHEQTLSATHRLAGALEDLGRLQEAEELFQEALEGQRGRLGDEHPDTLASMGGLAALYTDLGRYDEAKQLYDDSLDERRKVYGDEHPKTLVAEARLAKLYDEQGRWDDAQAGHERVLEARTRILGEQHPTTLESMRALAAIYEKQTRYADAEQLAQSAYDGAAELFGADHPKVCAFAETLGQAYSARGRRPEALALFERNLEILSERYGEAHPETLGARFDLAVRYNNWADRLDETNELIEQTYRLARESLGEEHPDTLYFGGQLSITYLNQRRLDEAEELATRVLDDHRRLLGNDHPDTFEAMRALRIIYENRQRPDDAEKLIVEELEGRRRVFGGEHHATTARMVTLAYHYIGQKRYDEAQELFKQVVAIRERLLGEEHPWTIGSYGDLAWSYETKQQMEKSMEFRRKQVAMRKRIAERDDATAQEKFLYAGFLTWWTHASLRDPAAALPFARAANEMTDFGNHEYLRVLADASFQSGDTPGAIEAQQKAIALLTEDEKELRNNYEGRMADFQTATGDIGKSRELELARLGRLREKAEGAETNPRAKNDYAWALLTADVADLRDPATALDVALRANDETGHEQPDLLGTLALAYHKTGDREKALELQRLAIAKLPEDNPWARPFAQCRLEVYSGDLRYEIDYEAELMGEWTVKVGPVVAPFAITREGDVLTAALSEDISFARSGWPAWRVDLSTGKVEVNAAGPNDVPRFEPGYVALNAAGEMLTWDDQSWNAFRWKRAASGDTTADGATRPTGR